MIGIIGAMEQEISVILSEMKNVTVVHYGKRKFYVADYNGLEVVIVKSGVGMVNASITTTILHTIFKVDKVIFSGVAGSTHEDVNTLDLVIGNAFVEYMFDVTLAGNYVKGQIAGTEKRDIDPSYEMLDLCEGIDTGVKTHFGRIASADIFVDSKAEKIRIKNEFETMAVDMESGAVAQTCTELEIPYLIIRSISDSLTDDSGIEFEEFLNLASINSKNYLIELLKRLQ